MGAGDVREPDGYRSKVEADLAQPGDCLPQLGTSPGAGVVPFDERQVEPGAVGVFCEEGEQLFVSPVRLVRPVTLPLQQFDQFLGTEA